MDAMMIFKKQPQYKSLYDEFDEEVVVVNDNAVAVLEDGDSADDSSQSDENVSEEQIFQDIQNIAIQFDQLNFPEDQSDSTCCDVNLLLKYNFNFETLLEYE